MFTDIQTANFLGLGNANSNRSTKQEPEQNAKENRIAPPQQ